MSTQHIIPIKLGPLFSPLLASLLMSFAPLFGHFDEFRPLFFMRPRGLPSVSHGIASPGSVGVVHDVELSQ